LRPISTTTTEIDTLPGEEVKFSISEENSPFVIRSMADLYSNRELASIREYSTNARDAMIEAGKADEPIVVTLPTTMFSNPKFIVQDFGVGMSRTELKETYTKFGKSTKRDRDDSNGMLGFGSKSAVAYTNTFKVISVKNGLRNEAVIHRTEDSDGGYIITMKILLSDIPTNDPNGTTVEIPVHNSSEFTRKANDFYRFWKPGTVLVNGQVPQWHVGDKMTEGLYMTPNGGTSYVVMANVPYPIVGSDHLFRHGMRKLSFVAFVEPCECEEWRTHDKQGNPLPYHAPVEFTPNREALKYSDHTKAHLHKVIKDFCDTAIANAKKGIAAAQTHWEAFDAWNHWCAVIGKENVPDLYYKGTKLDDTFAIQGFSYNRSRSRYNTDHITQVYVKNIPDRIFITDFLSGSPSSYNKGKVREWAAFKGISFTHAIFTTGKVDSPWVNPSRIVTWETLKAEIPKAPKAPRAVSTAPGRKAGTFDLVGRAGRINEQDVPITNELYYVALLDLKRMENRGQYLSRVLDSFDLDHKIVLMPVNRLNKFLRFYPHAKPVSNLLESMLKLDGKALLSQDAITVLNIYPEHRETLKHLDPSKVDDPKIKSLIPLVKVKEDEYCEEYYRQERLARFLGKHDKFNSCVQVRSTYDRKHKPLSDYPLLPSSTAIANNVVFREHAYLYMNVVYKTQKETK
jgi:hypothetical protein